MNGLRDNYFPITVGFPFQRWAFIEAFIRGTSDTTRHIFFTAVRFFKL